MVAPSSDGFGDPGVTTTDRTGIEGVNDGTHLAAELVSPDYTTRFGGTSASAPMVARVPALMLEADPALGWRDVREILALSARRTGTALGEPASTLERTPWLANAGTRLNGGGFHVSANYGFGPVDARAAVRLVETWDAQQTSANEQVRIAVFAGGLVLDSATPAHGIPLQIAPALVAGQVTLALGLSGLPAQDLEIVLTSLRGTESTLFFHSGGRARSAPARRLPALDLRLERILRRGRHRRHPFRSLAMPQGRTTASSMPTSSKRCRAWTMRRCWPMPMGRTRSPPPPPPSAAR